MLHSNPGDYAWGQGGLDAVITQVRRHKFQGVVSQFENKKRYIYSIPSLFPPTFPNAVFVQLLGQLENTGPPPAEKEKISSLPTVSISQEQAGQCFRPLASTGFLTVIFASSSFPLLSTLKSPQNEVTFDCPESNEEPNFAY